MKSRAKLLIWRDHYCCQSSWFWELHLSGKKWVNCRVKYKSRAAAKKAARRWAERHNMRVTEVVEE